MLRSSRRNPPQSTSTQSSQPPSGEHVAETSAVHFLDEPEADPMRGPRDRAHASFRALLELSSDLAMVHRDGRIVFVNPALVRALGLGSIEEVVGTPVVDLYDGESLPVVEARILAPSENAATLPSRSAGARRVAHPGRPRRWR
jgi:PAS domain-containing protein